MSDEESKSRYIAFPIADPSRISPPMLNAIFRNLRKHILDNLASEDARDLRSALSQEGWLLGGPVDKDKKEWFCEMCKKITLCKDAACTSTPDCKGIYLNSFFEFLEDTGFNSDQLTGEDGQWVLNKVSGGGVEHKIVQQLPDETRDQS